MNSVGVPLNCARIEEIRGRAKELNIGGLVIQESPFSSDEVIVCFGQGFENSAKFERYLMDIQKQDNDKNTRLHNKLGSFFVYFSLECYNLLIILVFCLC